MLNVVCIKWGDAFDPHYVNALKRGVERNLSLPHRFVCWTEDENGVEAECLPFTHPEHKGWWQKVFLFEKRADMEGPRLFFDLDTVIKGPIDDMAAATEFTMLRDFYQRDRAASGMLMIPDEFGEQVVERYLADPIAAQDRCSGVLGDGHWIDINVESKRFWQDDFPDKVISYKVHCQDRLPRDASVICFHGRPRPHEITELWMGKLWE